MNLFSRTQHRRVKRHFRFTRSSTLVSCLIFTSAVVLLQMIQSRDTSLVFAESSSSSSSSSVEPYRQCGSEGTIFQDVRTIDDARTRYTSWMSAVVEERQELLSDPSHWECESTEEPSLEILEQLAGNLPAWHYRHATDASIFERRYENVLRPVTFDSFSSILGEFQREYECTLTELQSESFAVIGTNRDYPAETEFCCAGNACAVATDAGDSCDGERRTGQCPDSCPTASPLMRDIGTRLQPFHSRALAERNIARIALERTLLTLRSYEIEHQTLRQFSCFERISLDLLNETALLSEAASCLPRVWDSATSLHDRKPSP